MWLLPAVGISLNYGEQDSILNCKDLIFICISHTFTRHAVTPAATESCTKKYNNDSRMWPQSGAIIVSITIVSIMVPTRRDTTFLSHCSLPMHTPCMLSKCYCLNIQPRVMLLQAPVLHP